MKAGILFTGSGPILILTTYESFTDRKLVEKLVTKGIKKFIAHTVPIEMVKKKYGVHFPIVMGDLKQTDDLRVLDYDGYHVFNTFSFKEMGAAVYYEP